MPYAPSAQVGRTFYLRKIAVEPPWGRLYYRLWMYRVALAVCIALAISGCGGDDSASKPASTSGKTGAETASREQDQQRATAAVLGLSDLGPEWERYYLVEDPIVQAEINCFGFEPTNDLVQTAHVAGEAFATGPPNLLTAGRVFPRGTHVATSSVTFYETEEDARTAFSRLVDSLSGEPVPRCLFFANKVPKGPRLVGVNGAFNPNFAKVTEQARAQQYNTRIAKKGGTIWVDFVVMQEERALGVVFVSSMEVPRLIEPISNDFVLAIATIMGSRLAP